MQALLGEHAWDWRAALKGLQRFILDHLGDSEAVLVLDETAELKKGQMTVGCPASMRGSPARSRTARPWSSWRM
jgi:SRSO17 transposase